MSADGGNDEFADLTREEMMSALFTNLIFQNTNMALMFLGRVPHPETQQKIVDTEAARVFIDQLEMLEIKTKGNLSAEEQKLLQQSLTHLRMAFVETTRAMPQDSAPSSPTIPSATSTEEESTKRFSKKY